MSDMTMVERVARALDREEAAQMGEPDPWSQDGPDFEEWRLDRLAAVRAGLGAMQEPSDAFLALVAERMHDARFSRSGETYPVLRSFLRAVVDAALSEQKP